jgi:hypothetical protein
MDKNRMENPGEPISGVVKNPAHVVSAAKGADEKTIGKADKATRHLKDTGHDAASD